MSDRSRRDDPRSDRPGSTPGFGRGLASRARGSVNSYQLATSPRELNLRVNIILVLIVLMAAVVAIKLTWVQGVTGPGLAAQAQQQRTITETEQAARGAIYDRSGNPLAVTLQARSLTFHPIQIKEILDARHEADPEANKPTDERLTEIAQGLADRLGDDVLEEDILDKITQDVPFVYLARNVVAYEATEITTLYPEVTSERQDIREYPDGAVAANIIGSTGWDGAGLFGFEQLHDVELTGIDGSRTYDRATDGTVVPGSLRNQHPAIDGKDFTLTIDTDTQYFVQQQLEQAVANSLAQSAWAVVLDTETGEVLAMANNNTFNPVDDLAEQLENNVEINNPAINSPFEPGSVNKLITAAAALEDGLTTPEEVHQVPGSIHMAGVTVSDAWTHGVEPYTTTGIFGKSSNVGTLMLAEKVGEQRFAQMLRLFGLGQQTGIELPANPPARSRPSNNGPAAPLPTSRSARACRCPCCR